MEKTRTAIPIIIEGQFQVFQRFSSSKLVLQTVESCFVTLNYSGNGSTSTCIYKSIHTYIYTHIPAMAGTHTYIHIYIYIHTHIRNTYGKASYILAEEHLDGKWTKWNNNGGGVLVSPKKSNKLVLSAAHLQAIGEDDEEGGMCACVHTHICVRVVFFFVCVHTGCWKG